MASHLKSQDEIVKLPDLVVWLVGVLSIVPVLLGVMGLDVGRSLSELDVAAIVNGLPPLLIDRVHQVMAGSFTHTILEWSAVCIAFLTAMLALIHFSVQGNITTPVIGVALLCAGIMDAFHILAADRLLAVAVSHDNLTVLTWVISRTVNVVILCIGAGLVLSISSQSETTKRDRGVGAFLLIALLLIVIVCGILDVWISHVHLPTLSYPSAIVGRPWDLLPLVMFMIAGCTLFPHYNRKFPSLFSHAIIISTIPHVAAQLHMALGSHVLFDHDFFVAHALKIVAYIVPLIGLVLDYVRAYHEEARAVAWFQLANNQLSKEITDRQSAQAELKTVEERSRYLVESSLDMIIAVDTERHVVEFNRAAEDAFGYQKEEIMGQDINTLYASPADTHRVTEQLRLTGSFSGELMNRRKDGSELPVYLSASLLRDAKGRVIGFMGISRDISEQKELEETLWEKVHELEEFETLIVGRENQMIQLKNEINRLSESLGQSPRYDVEFTDDESE